LNKDYILFLGNDDFRSTTWWLIQCRKLCVANGRRHVWYAVSDPFIKVKIIACQEVQGTRFGKKSRIPILERARKGIEVEGRSLVLAIFGVKGKNGKAKLVDGESLRTSMICQ